MIKLVTTRTPQRVEQVRVSRPAAMAHMGLTFAMGFEPEAEPERPALRLVKSGPALRAR